MLWQKIIEQNKFALSNGFLHPIPTNSDYIESFGIKFVIRISGILDKKYISNFNEKKKGTNPFLPYEKELFVDNLTQTHFCLLNKFNVVNHHILIITKAFEEQESLLNLHDFKALWTCLSQIEGLAFYNGGKLAGASQKHKHLQLIPMDLSLIPIDNIVRATYKRNTITISPLMPFLHGIIHFELDKAEDSALLLLESYKILQKRFPSRAYNLLVTNNWMLLVPRSREKVLNISLNSLAFAGCFFVRSQEYFDKLAQYGPLNLLRDAGYSSEKELLI
jgi:ATP adenylyltransferase